MLDLDEYFSKFKAAQYPECGGMGMIVYGDGGGPNGKYTDTGYSETCYVCRGHGLILPPGMVCSGSLP